MLLKIWYKNPVNNHHNLTYQKGIKHEQRSTGTNKNQFRKNQQSF